MIGATTAILIGGCSGNTPHATSPSTPPIRTVTSPTSQPKACTAADASVATPRFGDEQSPQHDAYTAAFDVTTHTACTALLYPKVELREGAVPLPIAVRTRGVQTGTVLLEKDSDYQLNVIVTGGFLGPSDPCPHQRVATTVAITLAKGVPPQIVANTKRYARGANTHDGLVLCSNSMVVEQALGPG